MNALTGISEGFSAVLVGVVGFVILWLMERVWKRMDRSRRISPECPN